MYPGRGETEPGIGEVPSGEGRITERQGSIADCRRQTSKSQMGKRGVRLSLAMNWSCSVLRLTEEAEMFGLVWFGLTGPKPASGGRQDGEEGLVRPLPSNNLQSPAEDWVGKRPVTNLLVIMTVYNTQMFPTSTTHWMPATSLSKVQDHPSGEEAGGRA